jgi:hypothetical protein
MYTFTPISPTHIHTTHTTPSLTLFTRICRIGLSIGKDAVSKRNAISSLTSIIHSSYVYLPFNRLAISRVIARVSTLYCSNSCCASINHIIVIYLIFPSDSHDLPTFNSLFRNSLFNTSMNCRKCLCILL